MSCNENLLCDEDNVESLNQSFENEKHTDHVSFSGTPSKKVNKENFVGISNDSQIGKKVLFNIVEYPNFSKLSTEEMAESCNSSLSKLQEKVKKTMFEIFHESNSKSSELEQTIDKYESLIFDLNSKHSQHLNDNKTYIIRLERDLAYQKSQLNEKLNEIASVQKLVQGRDSEIEILQNKNLALARNIDNLVDQIKNFDLFKEQMEKLNLCNISKIEELQKMMNHIQSEKFYFETKFTSESKCLQEALSNLKMKEDNLNDLRNTLSAKESIIHEIEIEKSLLKGKLTGFDSKMQDELDELKKILENKSEKFSISMPSKDPHCNFPLSELQEIKMIIGQTKEDNSRLKLKLMNYEKILYFLYKTLNWYQEELKLKENQITILRIHIHDKTMKLMDCQSEVKIKSKAIANCFQDEIMASISSFQSSITKKLDSFNYRISRVDDMQSQMKKFILDNNLSKCDDAKTIRYFSSAVKTSFWSLNYLCAFIKRFLEEEIEDFNDPIVSSYYKIAQILHENQIDRDQMKSLEYLITNQKLVFKIRSF